MKQQKLSGFSLIEILVVLAVIGVLISFVAPMVIDRPDQARAVKLRADFETIQSALMLYRLDTGQYPTDAEGLTVLVNGEPKYLASSPIDPWGGEYQYRMSQSGSITIFSFGPDGGNNGGSGDDIEFQISQ
jgi:general secretion pathway protein G